MTFIHFYREKIGFSTRVVIKLGHSQADFLAPLGCQANPPFSSITAPVASPGLQSLCHPLKLTTTKKSKVNTVPSISSFTFQQLLHWLLQRKTWGQGVTTLRTQISKRPTLVCVTIWTREAG